MQPTGTPNPTLIQQLTTSCQSWAHSLWHNIRPHDNLYRLHETLGQGQTIFLVSNASINHQGQGTIAWIIHSRTKLWSGEGIVPGPISKVYSRLAEAYGVLLALSFLQQYATHFPITVNVKPHLYVCCDNQGVIERINNYQHQPVNPNHTLFDEYGIYHAIHLIHQSLPTFSVKYIHILGHQDQQNKNKLLSLKA